MGYYNEYSHLDNDRDPALFTMDDIAEWAARQNYGTHRPVCALVRAHRKRFPNSKLAKALNEAVDKYTT